MPSFKETIEEVRENANLWLTNSECVPPGQSCACPDCTLWRNTVAICDVLLSLAPDDEQDEYVALTEAEQKVWDHEGDRLGAGYSSQCLPAWIESFSRWWDEKLAEKKLSAAACGNLLHTLIAARRRNYLMAQEIKHLKKLLFSRTVDSESTTTEGY